MATPPPNPSAGLTASSPPREATCSSAATTLMKTVLRRMAGPPPSHPLLPPWKLLTCACPPGWAGHHRGSNATQETVICPLSFEPGKRQHLDAVCGWGHTIIGSPLNMFWAVDLLHRVLHVPMISEGAVGHFAEDYGGVLELAKTKPERSVRDSETLQLFALEVWAMEVAAPGVGCLGEGSEVVGENPAVVTTTKLLALPATTTTKTVPASAMKRTTTYAVVAAPTPTAHVVDEVDEVSTFGSGTGQSEADKMQNCHTHADGVVHCDDH